MQRHVGYGASDDDDEDEPVEEDVTTAVEAAAAALGRVRVDGGHQQGHTCAQQAADLGDVSVSDLAGYLENSVVFPKPMSRMAEMMYT